MRNYKVEYEISVPDHAYWDIAEEYNLKYIDPGIDLPYVYVPEDAMIVEVKPPVDAGMYSHQAGSLYKKSDDQWYVWSYALGSWNETGIINASNEHGFLTVLTRIDA